MGGCKSGGLRTFYVVSCLVKPFDSLTTVDFWLIMKTIYSKLFLSLSLSLSLSLTYLSDLSNKNLLFLITRLCAITLVIRKQRGEKSQQKNQSFFFQFSIYGGCIQERSCLCLFLPPCLTLSLIGSSGSRISLGRNEDCLQVSAHICRFLLGFKNTVWFLSFSLYLQLY